MGWPFFMVDGALEAFLGFVHQSCFACHRQYTTFSGGMSRFLPNFFLVPQYLGISNAVNEEKISRVAYNRRGGIENKMQ